MNTMLNAKTTRLAAPVAPAALATALLALALVACAAFAPRALANQMLDAPTSVSDDITRVHVNKLDADTHEYVEGASMAIIEKDTNVTVDEWVTGRATHTNEKHLDVGKVYIMREVSAPDGYEKVSDTEFTIEETEGGGVSIVSGSDDVELTESYVVNLYDKATQLEDALAVTNNREVTRPNDATTTNRTVAPKTGDETPLNVVLVLVVVGVLAIALLEVPKRRMKG